MYELIDTKKFAIMEKKESGCTLDYLLNIKLNECHKIDLKDWPNDKEVPKNLYN